MSDSTEQKKPPTDWEGIERDYRAGILSIREIAQEHGISHTAIGKRATKDGWTRDLTAKIKAKAEALVSKDAVASEVASGNKVSEKEIVEANALVVAAVDRRHKATSKRGQELVDKLIAELEITTDNLEDFQKLGELLDKSGLNDNGKWVEDKLNKIYHAVISTGGRVDSLKKLAETFEKFAKFERVAYRLEDGDQSGDNNQSNTTVDNELARRVAFILSKGLRANKG
jgi:hypothetical protein